MKRIPSICPSCQSKLRISSLKCENCALELRSNFEQNPFDQLTESQYLFLMSFLRNRGNLKNLQCELQISYPMAKKTLDEILVALGLEEEITANKTQPEVIDMKNLFFDRNSHKASDIIKAKLAANGGHATVYTLQGLPCQIWANADGKSFDCDKLPVSPSYTFDTFDLIVDLLRSQNGRARKGNGRSHRLGEPECDDTTIVGIIAEKCSGKKIGDSVFDPVFVFAAILDWAGIASNERGELVLTEAYRREL